MIMTDTEMHRRLTDLPANARPWTSDRQVRAAAGSDTWYVFFPGELVRCPSCSQVLTEFGTGQGCAVRVHPDQRHQDRSRQYAPPTSVRGEARSCRCGKYLDLRFLPIAHVESRLEG